jgi:hypothetical protein
MSSPVINSTAGALAIPPPAVKRDDGTPGDPALDAILGFLQAVCNTYLATGWTAISRADSVSGPVRKIFAHDPQERSFSDNDLPAFFLFREGSRQNVEDIAEDYRLHFDSLRLFWVLTPTQQEIQRYRRSFMNAMAKCIDEAIERGRDPSWAAATDTNPRAATKGTILLAFANIWRLEVLSWRATNLVIQPFDRGDRRTFQAMDMQLDIQEQLERDWLTSSLTYESRMEAQVKNRQPAEGIAGGEADVIISITRHLGGFDSGFDSGFSGFS